MEQTTEILWSHWPEGWATVFFWGLVIGIGYVVVRLYLSEAKACPRPIQILLAALRLAALAVLGIALLGPSWSRREKQTIYPQVAILRDVSASMKAEDVELEPGKGRRTDWVRANTVSEASPFRSLESRTTVQMAEFARESAPFAVLPKPDVDSPVATDAQNDPKRSLPQETSADETVTDLANAISSALKLDRLSAIVVITDGQHTGAGDPRDAAREAKRLGAPIFAVGVGSEKRPRNIEVTSVQARSKVWANEPFEVEVVLWANLDEPEDLQVELRELAEGAASEGTVIARKTVSAPRGGGRIVCSFQHAVKNPGKLLLSATVEPLRDEESLVDNTRAAAAIQVLGQNKARVLLVSGAPTWEYRILEKLLLREEDLIVSCWLQSLDEGRSQEGVKVIDHLPITKDELFWYDVVVLLDPDPREVDSDWVNLLKAFTSEHGGGVLYLAGPRFTAELLTGPRTLTFRDVLPVRFGDVHAMEVASLLTSNSQGWPVKVSTLALDHPVLKFTGDLSRDQTRWESLPGVYWSFPSLEAKPTSTVLLEHGDPTLRSAEGARPMLVSGRYGSGNVLYVGFQGTWRWRRVGNDAEFFDRFWLQAIRHLTQGRSLEGSRRGTFQVDRDRYELGAKARLVARLYDSKFEPLEVDQVQVVIENAGAPTSELFLKRTSGQAGAYSGTFTPNSTGVHTARLEGPESEGERVRMETSFTVDTPELERTKTWLDRPLLEELATLSGGKYFSMNDLDQVVGSIPDRREEIETRGPPIPLWDNAWTLCAVVVLLALEWGIRKRFKLI